ncbi:MAG: EAL domain-containing protein [Candidatus Brocadia sp.]|nr:EAL domain-containing protein [Candidatus Brocadia sp.]UJS18661.1 MAG: EAL domain-containing protein [Candidatus Jettenia sp.]
MGSEKLRILLVDDDKDDYIIARDILSEIERVKYDLHWESTYKNALRVLSENQFDICLFDYRLGEKTGLELLREAIKSGYKGPIIILTGQGDYEIDNEVIKAGASDYLVKGQISSSLLERSIRHALERKRIEEALVTAKDYAENLINSSIDMIIATNIDRMITEFNPAAQKVFGYSKCDVLHKPIHLLFANHEVWQDINKKIEQEKVFLGEVVKKKKSGEIFHSYLSASILRDSKGQDVGIIGISRDITIQKRLGEQMLYNAYHDSLTDLPNRNYFMNYLEKTITYTRMNKSNLFAVFFLDIDRFKIINDSLGHTIGDKLLISIAERLKECLRCNDIVARFGGDEFVLLLDNIKDVACTKAIAEKILKRLKEPFCLDGHTVFTSASIGIVLHGEYYDRPEDILRDADIVMYRVKENGRSNYAMFDKKMHFHAVKVLQLEEDMQKAIVNNEFKIYYQPIVSLADDNIVGFESLIRWEHPRRGLVSPEEFIPLAEETGMIESIGSWVIKEALSQNNIWYNSGYLHLYVSVNVSARQFRNRNLTELIQRILDETGMNMRNFYLEITESTAMEDMNRCVKILKELRDIGIKIMLDDFGTGFSSINNLRFLPVDGIKIDLSLTRDIATNSDAATIARAIINMAHGLNKKVIAEGVETEAQIKFLRSHNCDMVQGYFFSKPKPAHELIRLL